MIKINAHESAHGARRRAKLIMLIHAAFLVLVLAVILIRRAVFINGFKLLANALFELSERYQMYEYDMFEVTESASDAVFALVLLSAMLAALLTFALYRKNIIIIAVVFLLFTGAQIYFGVFPPALPSIFLYAAFAAAVIYCSPTGALTARRSCVSAALALTALSVIIILAWTGENPSLHSLSEDIRDQFGERVERPAASAISEQGESFRERSVQELLRRNPVSRQRGGASAMEHVIYYDYDHAASEAGAVSPRRLLPLVIFFSVLISAPAAWLIFRLRGQAKRRKLFNAAGHAPAIDAMFKYLMDWLTSYGLEPRNDVYSSYIGRIKDLARQEYADKYIHAVNIWQEAVYSEHEMTGAKREFMRGFMRDTTNMIKKNVGALARLKLALGYFGGTEEWAE